MLCLILVKPLKSPQYKILEESTLFALFKLVFSTASVYIYFLKIILLNMFLDRKEGCHNHSTAE